MYSALCSALPRLVPARPHARPAPASPRRSLARFSGSCSPGRRTGFFWHDFRLSESFFGRNGTETRKSCQNRPIGAAKRSSENRKSCQNGAFGRNFATENRKSCHVGLGFGTWARKVENRATGHVTSAELATLLPLRLCGPQVFALLAKRALAAKFDPCVHHRCACRGWSFELLQRTRIDGERNSIVALALTTSHREKSNKSYPRCFLLLLCAVYFVPFVYRGKQLENYNCLPQIKREP